MDRVARRNLAAQRAIAVEHQIPLMMSLSWRDTSGALSCVGLTENDGILMTIDRPTTHLFDAV